MSRRDGFGIGRWLAVPRALRPVPLVLALLGAAAVGCSADGDPPQTVADTGVADTGSRPDTGAADTGAPPQDVPADTGGGLDGGGGDGGGDASDGGGGGDGSGGDGSGGDGSGGGDADGCAPSDEVCDGVDNDCDGRVDEDLGTTRCGMGVCERTVAACVRGAPSMCTPGSASPETCDRLDNDCNGMVDDGLGTTECGMGACRRTVENCVDGAPRMCRPGAPSPEICDGIDNDCNGMVDDGLGRTTCGMGLCERTVDNCAMGRPQMCTTGMAGPESCNGMDDNCDGIIDEGLGSTTCGLGVCRRTQQNCVRGMITACAPGEPGVEICNGVDDDCDGMTDEMLGTTMCGVGACSRMVVNCIDGRSQTCVPGSPMGEVCDGADNNCDGMTDEGNPGGGGICSSGLPGVCSIGTRMCRGGTHVCEPNVAPMTRPELCDGLDNDCDGAVDEGDPEGGEACDTGERGICSAGVRHCVSARLACVRTLSPSAEICDGMDNNCNGSTDEGFMPVTCGVGACQRTVAGCSGGSTGMCTPGPTAPEVCNNRDDNCDGMTDNAPPTTLCPPPAGVVTPACAVGGVCQVAPGGCAPGRFDVDASYDNGCECVDDTNGAACMSPTNLASINAGGAAIMTAVSRIPEAGREDWFVVNFPQNPSARMNGTGAPRITFSSNEGTVFRFEVRSSCAATAILGCGSGSMNASGLQDWSFTDNQSTAGAEQWNSRAVGWPSTVYIRVYRTSPGLSCNSYQLRITR